MAVCTILTIKMYRLVSIICMKAGIGMADLTDTIINEISIGKGTPPSMRGKPYFLGAAIWCKDYFANKTQVTCINTVMAD
jgi:hypothetical protein